MDARATPTDPESPLRQTRARSHLVRTWLVRVIGAIGGTVGAWAGYGFGHEVSGVLLGVVAGANCAIFGALIAGSLLDVLLKRLLPA
jgi:zinc transporter ZupT